MIYGTLYKADHENSEKLLRLDAKRREYNVLVIGEEEHLAYNRVGLSTFFQHRKVEDLYLNPKEWVRSEVTIAKVIVGDIC